MIPSNWLVRLSIGLWLCGPMLSAAEPAADVIVYGSTPGGFCAAIAASREGARVILLEPSDHVGGLNTGGLSFSDSNQTVRSTVMGLFDEWHTRIEQDYTSRGIRLPYQVHVKDQSRWTYEPHVAARVTDEMLREADVRVLRGHVLQSVQKQGTQITALVTTQGTFTADAYVDASYEGDLMAAAGVEWTIGREGREEFGESLAGKQYPKSTMKIDGFDEDGEPLPLITTTDAGEEAAGDRHVMTYSFRLCLTEDPDNRVPFPKPKRYDPQRFEALRRYIRAGGSVGFDMYALPGDKWDGNNSIGGQFSLGLVGGGDGWCEADQEQRAAIWEAHKQYTLEFYQFLTSDPVVPAATREKYSRLGLCRDEFSETAHFSPALYVREGRRMRGLYVLSEKDILQQPEKADPIAVSSFPIDSHDCQRVALPGVGVVNEGTIFPVRQKHTRHGYAYHVPYRSILPRPQQCSNLLVPVALSCTHVGISSIRVEPTWMILGQSAGIAAALAAKGDGRVHDLPYAELRTRLLAQGQVLDLPPPAVNAADLPGVVDDQDARLSGTWKPSTNFAGHVGSGYVHDDRRGDGQSRAVFRYTPPKSGRYELQMAYSAHPTRANNVPVEIAIGSDTQRLVVDQTQPLPAGKAFRPLTRVSLQQGVETVLRIENRDTNGFVIVDAVRWVPVP